jgi:hypothetical protein
VRPGIHSPDADFGGGHLRYWGLLIHGELRSLPTGTFNAGLFWIRHFVDPRSIAEYALRSNPALNHP